MRTDIKFKNYTDDNGETGEEGPGFVLAKKRTQI